MKAKVTCSFLLKTKNERFCSRKGVCQMKGKWYCKQHYGKYQYKEHFPSNEESEYINLIDNTVNIDTCISNEDVRLNTKCVFDILMTNVDCWGIIKKHLYAQDISNLMFVSTRIYKFIYEIYVKHYKKLWISQFHHFLDNNLNSPYTSDCPTGIACDASARIRENWSKSISVLLVGIPAIEIKHRLALICTSYKFNKLDIYIDQKQSKDQIGTTSYKNHDGQFLFKIEIIDINTCYAEDVGTQSAVDWDIGPKYDISINRHNY